MTETAKIINFKERREERLAGEPIVELPKAIEIPDIITPKDIDSFDDDQLDSLLNHIRLRRLASTLVYERTMKEKEEVTQGKARDMLEKKCEQVWSELNRAFKVLDRLELRVNEMRALRLQAGLDW